MDNLIHALHPWVSFGIMPLFALANAGIPIQNISYSALMDSPIPLGIGLGLFVGKPVGIILVSTIAVFLGIAVFPKDLKWKHLIGAACLGGIGFTMAIFMTNLSLPQEQTVGAKVAILVASAFSALLGYFLLSISLDPE